MLAYVMHYPDSFDGKGQNSMIWIKFKNTTIIVKVELYQFPRFPRRNVAHVLRWVRLREWCCFITGELSYFP